MLSTSNGHHKSNGKVSPMDDDTMKQLEKQEINNTNITIPNYPVEPTETVAKKSFIYKLFKKDQKVKEKEKEAQAKKKPEARKLKRFEIVCFQLI